ncbi:class I SAM-dependent methyltransferase [Allosphingosinicella indica]|uniref:Nodulation-related protein NoeA n=1 Tax=Allosphingosinicella indica TaxID=941907 RepID=A0A1X7H029_9SPHN|nr:class I SAM-dependent methyltransferase [Allosphingosinicella indica]SMF77288.1 nodulation-related protein NoeA [Allosphingosinicella indica]
MTAMIVEPGSFRDPGGRVFDTPGAILRSIMPSAADGFRQTRDSGFLDRLVGEGRLVPYQDVSAADRPDGLDGAAHVLEHPRLPFISYPYEWSFSLHRAAALFHLDLHLDALERGFTLADATAYNVQFDGVRPIFIDHLSLRPYVEGEIWAGHRQFCMQFLNPLLLWSALEVQPNHWFRGNLEGISPEDTAKLLPFRKKLSWTVAVHVAAQAAMQRRSVRTSTGSASYRQTKFPLEGAKAMLRGLRRKIAGLKPPSHATVWGDYAGRNSYQTPDAAAKAAFVAEMTAAVQPRLLYDLGCNSGDYSVVALESGAGKVVGFDFDHGALELAYSRAAQQKLDFLPLWLDAANPSPSQGWGQAERKGLAGRAAPDAVVALAFIHHITIGRNVPLDMAVRWIVDMAPAGIIEFPDKADPMVQSLLAQRPDIFPDYSDANFAKLLGDQARIVKTAQVNDGTRTLYWFDRSGG